MAAIYQAAVAGGHADLWGTPLRFIEPESEHSSASAAEGVALAGGRVTNFTAGQGLVLMKEVLYVIAGKRLPVVFHVGARALTSQALNIHAGHDDVMAVADTGWGIVFARNAQEAADLAAIARRDGRGGRDAVHRRPGRVPHDAHARERAPARGRAAARVRGRSAPAHPRPVRSGRGADDRRRPEPGQLHEGPDRPAGVHGPTRCGPRRVDGRVDATHRSPDTTRSTPTAPRTRPRSWSRWARWPTRPSRSSITCAPPAVASAASRSPRSGRSRPTSCGRSSARRPRSPSSSGPTNRWPRDNPLTREVEAALYERAEAGLPVPRVLSVLGRARARATSRPATSSRSSTGWPTAATGSRRHARPRHPPPARPRARSPSTFVRRAPRACAATRSAGSAS